ncbi:uncharacterized protein [Cebidichthys violaceus]|uniref:uncharacterized protein isoform X2 n=1 Tax=Cebidichthys violaceus TaxID=271503 RepID=UPI0035CA0720
MAGAGLCCASLEEPKTLMKMGLSMILVGHVNFLLGALMHGVVLRHINLHKQARAMEYAISNVVALTSGLAGIVVGILAIVLSKNKKSRGLSTTLILWVPLIVTCVIQTVFSARCFAVCVSFLGLPCCPNNKRTRDSGRPINVVRPMKEAAPSHYPEPPRSCPESPRSHREPPRSHREPPRSYPEPPRSHREPPRSYTEPPTCYSEPPRSYTEPPTCYSEPPRSYTEPPRSYSEPPGSYTEPPRSYTEPPRSYTEPPRSYSEPPGSYTEPPTRYSDPRSHRKPPRQNTEPPRQQRRPPPPPQHPPHQHRSPPPSERRPLRQPKRERSDGGRQETRVGSQQRAAEKHQLLERATLERSSFWI